MIRAGRENGTEFRPLFPHGAARQKEKRIMEFENKDYKVFELFNKRWALATAGVEGDYNTCTIGWGSLGSIWHGEHGAMPIATIYIHPDRYTLEFLQKYDHFTVSFFGEEYRPALSYLGSHSGRDGDKVSAAGLTPVPMGESVTFREAELSFLCKKLYGAQFRRECFAPEINEGIYKNWEPHWMFIGGITEVDDRR